MEHDFPFDPTYGYDRRSLLAIEPPSAAADFAKFWRDTAAENTQVPLRLELKEIPSAVAGTQLSLVHFDTLDGLRVGAWLVVPPGKIERGIIVGHGYGGRQGPEYAQPLQNAVALFPCAPGFDLSARDDLPDTSSRHVVHGIQTAQTYILRACVASLWSAASVLLEMYPQIEGELYFSGGSFGGGLGALALPWDSRFKRSNLSVPTFGHHAIRLRCPCNGSGEAVRLYHQEHPEVVEVLAYYDAAVAATYGETPVFFSPALFDPAVPPPGQFAVYNTWSGPKELFVLSAGHFEYAAQDKEYRARQQQLQHFLATTGPDGR
jgi:cephalosporin-C deacetylase